MKAPEVTDVSLKCDGESIFRGGCGGGASGAHCGWVRETQIASGFLKSSVDPLFPFFLVKGLHVDMDV